MRSVGLVLVALSILLGSAALWGLKVLGASRAEAGPAAAPIPRTELVVAARPIGFGEAITPDALKVQPWPAGAAPAGAFRSIGQVTGAGRRLALAPIAANEPILAERVSGPGGRATLAGLIRPGYRASTLRVDDVLGVAGFVLPGDSVDVLVTRPDGADKTQMRSDVLLRGVRVLAVDQLADQDKNKPVVAKAATLEVTAIQAQKIALASQVGALSLALRSAEDPVAGAPGEASSIRVADLRDGADGAPVRSGPHRPHRGHRGASAPDGPSVQVYRGSEVTRVSVAAE
ncbi:Flp pilus assembly protein CpaB [Phenylobacterium sp.]|uniref:Flp pilus assembly protein CpaB n=1 Tax=Phenylobacterium sp. TaxID=1871053 RepID=UPI002DEDC62B|nr:Flp pilus assembly protein CpaB [Phenylobacterium sp.]